MEQRRRIVRVPADRAIEPQVVSLGLGPAPCRRISASVQAATASSNAAWASRATARSRHAIASPFLPIHARQRPRLYQADESRAIFAGEICKRVGRRVAGLPGRRGAAARPRPRVAPGRAARGSDRSSGPPAASPWPIPGSIMPAVAAADSGSTRTRPLPRCPGRQRALASQMVPSLVDQRGRTIRFPGSMSRSAAFARFLVLVKTWSVRPGHTLKYAIIPRARAVAATVTFPTGSENRPARSPSSRQRGNSSVVSACA